MSAPPADPTPPVTVAAIIPVLGDASALDRLVTSLLDQSQLPDEIIVVDGVPQPQCRSLCEARGCRYLSTRPGRGHQLDTGARAANGCVLWFLHADGQPPRAGVRLIKDAVVAGASGGFFRFRFAGTETWYKRLLARLVNLRTVIGVPYGDQGLFATRQAYVAAGGFPDTPLFEEVPLVRAIRRNGRFIQLPAAINVSPRRWERDGWVRRTIENRLLALGYMLGISPGTLARRYRPIDREGSAKC